MSSSDDGSSPPIVSIGSPGSSVSSTLQEEYDDLLRHAVVVPNFDTHGHRTQLAAPGLSSTAQRLVTSMPGSAVSGARTQFERSPLLDLDDQQENPESLESSSGHSAGISQMFWQNFLKRRKAFLFADHDNHRSSFRGLSILVC